MPSSVFSDASDLILRSAAAGNMSRSRIYNAVPDVWRREVGCLSARKFANRLGAAEDLLLRFEIVKSLQMHLGCVNTVNFSSDGDTLLSGSDDKMVTLWDWQSGKSKLSFHSGHVNNVFQAKFIPLSENRSIVTSAADCQVRHAQISDSGEVKTVLLARHEGRVHNLAIEPGSPHVFYTCGEDGRVQHVDLRMKDARRLFTCRKTNNTQTRGRIVHLNAIAIDPRNPNLIAVAGSDKYARLYDLRNYNWDASTDHGRPSNKFCPPHLLVDDTSRLGITGLAFSEQSELLVSYFEENIYLFDSRMGLGPDHVSESEISGCTEGAEGLTSSDLYPEICPQVYKGHRNYATVKGVSFFGPNCDYVVSGSDCGHIFIWNKKDGTIIRAMEADKHVVNCIESHPYEAVLASSGIEKDIKIWCPSKDVEDNLPSGIEEIVLGHGHESIWFSGDIDEEYPFDGSFDEEYPFDGSFDDDDFEEDDSDDIDSEYDDDDDDDDDSDDNADYEGNEDDDVDDYVNEDDVIFGLEFEEPPLQ